MHYCVQCPFANSFFIYHIFARVRLLPRAQSNRVMFVTRLDAIRLENQDIASIRFGVSMVGE